MEHQRSEEQVIRERLTAPPSSRGAASKVETRLGLESAGSPREALAAERPLADDGGHDDDDDGEVSDEDFAFAVADSSSFDGLEAVTADEIFSNGLIRPVYPLFDRTTLVIDGGESSLRARGGGEAGEAAPAEKEKPAGQLPLRLRELILEDRDPPASASSSESEEPEGVPTGSYCVWAPRSAPASPDLRRKSHSAGASEGSKRWRLFGLVVGRSHSDGKERLVFLQEGAGAAGAGQPKKKAAGESQEAERRGKGKGRSPGRTTEMDMETAHRLFYARGGAAAAGNRRRSFLPYRKDLLGFFGNVNGPSTFQPF